MNQLLSYSIFFIFFILSKEEITYKYDDDDVYSESCFEISDINIESDTNKNPIINLKDLESLKKSQIALNAQNCRQNEKKEGIADGNKCCYASVFQKSKWHFFCADIPSTNAENVPKYIDELKEKYKNIFDDLKIDCFSKKFDIMIITLIISLIYLF